MYCSPKQNICSKDIDVKIDLIGRFLWDQSQHTIVYIFASFGGLRVSIGGNFCRILCETVLFAFHSYLFF